MQTQTLKIEIPNGFVVDSFDAKNGELKIRQAKTITERIKTLDNAIDILGNDDPEVVLYNQMFKAFSYENHIMAQQRIVIIVKALNEGWTPNWKNSDEYKYFPWFEMDGSSGFRFDGGGRWDACSVVGSRLCLKSRDLAVYAGTQFTEIYRSFMTL